MALHFRTKTILLFFVTALAVAAASPTNPAVLASANAATTEPSAPPRGSIAAFLARFLPSKSLNTQTPLKAAQVVHKVYHHPKHAASLHINAPPVRMDDVGEDYYGEEYGVEEDELEMDEPEIEESEMDAYEADESEVDGYEAGESEMEEDEPLPEASEEPLPEASEEAISSTPEPETEKASAAGGMAIPEWATSGAEAAGDESEIDTYEADESGVDGYEAGESEMEEDEPLPEASEEPLPEAPEEAIYSTPEPETEKASAAGGMAIPEWATSGAEAADVNEVSAEAQKN